MSRANRKGTVRVLGGAGKVYILPPFQSRRFVTAHNIIALGGLIAKLSKTAHNAS